MCATKSIVYCRRYRDEKALLANPPVAKPSANAVERLKMSSLVSIIGIGDLTRKANELVVTTYRPLEIYTFLILEYLILILIVSFFVRKLEKKLKKDSNN